MSGAVTRKSSKVSASTSVHQSAGLGLQKISTARKTGQDSDDEDKATKDGFDEERGLVDTIDFINEEKLDKSPGTLSS
jgi:hypothetical protein